jgi:uncharacterized Zn finger protein
VTTATVEEKASAILSSGRLTVVEVNADRARAVCTGSAGDVYQLSYDAAGWSCSCPARGRCSHLAAFRLVVLANSRHYTRS